MRILLLHDPINSNRQIASRLRAEGFVVETALDGQIADLLHRDYFELIILSAPIPMGEATRTLKLIRKLGWEGHVLFFGNRGSLAGRSECICGGGVSYIHEHCSIEELAVRVHAIQDHDEGGKSHIIQCGGVWLDLFTHSAGLNGVGLDLHYREFSLLELLVRNFGRPGSQSRNSALCLELHV